MTPIDIAGFAAIIAGTIGLGLACWAQRREIERISERSGAFLEDAFVFREALRAIAAMETPRANATVKRMAKTARAALEGLNNEQA
jgi:tagatose-1,6-bisphosphate aldolase